jgi:acetoin utilization deacetylase AcuC-like enzyme
MTKRVPYTEMPAREKRGLQPRRFFVKGGCRAPWGAESCGELFMLIFHDPECARYGSSMRPEQPARVERSAEHLRAAHPRWEWRLPPLADEAVLRLAHSGSMLQRLHHGPDFDDDTPFFPGIYEHARRAVGAALAASEHARTTHRPAFSLMRPPGHHATAYDPMGFCYLNQIAIAALAARQQGVQRVAVWDFDAHHGNGTEAILHNQPGVLFVSVHQFPGYPGTGTEDFDNCRNYVVAPHAPRLDHMRQLRRGWGEVLAFHPDLILVSAGFDAYAHDPITEMNLSAEDFGELGSWLKEAAIPAAAVLEGGYSTHLPLLIDSFLTAWAE